MAERHTHDWLGPDESCHIDHDEPSARWPEDPRAAEWARKNTQTTPEQPLIIHPVEWSKRELDSLRYWRHLVKSGRVQP